MNRRPWPIVVLAILQFLTPLLYLLFASGFYGTSISTVADELNALATPLRKFEIFILPLLIGVLILLMKRVGYYLAVIGCIYGIVRGVLAFIDSQQTDPVLPLVISNLVCAAALAYLARPKARNLFFNPRLRWWETDPRFVVDLPASITRVGATPTKAILQNVANGGAGIETSTTGFLKGEAIVVEFQYEGTVYHLKSTIAWERTKESSQQFLGIQWTEEALNSERSKVRRLIRALREKNTPTTRPIPSFWMSFKSRER